MNGELWTDTTIGELLSKFGGSIKTGPFGTALKAKEYSKNGVPLISVGEVGYGEFRIHDTTPRVPIEVVTRLPDYLLKTGDIVFGRKGAVDRSAIVKPEQEGWFLGSDGIRLRLPASCDSQFVAFQLQSTTIKNWLLHHATGSTMASLNQGIIERIPIRLPSLGVQNSISKILSDLSDKIALNRQINQTLEAMAQALFKSWFVDFEPVQAKIAALENGEGPSRAAMRAISGKTDAELATLQTTAPDAYTQLETTASLFPDTLVESELGLVPEGWEVKRINDILELSYGKALKSTERIAGEVPVYGSGGITGYHNQALVEGPGIIIGRKGTVGSIYYEADNFFPIDTVFYVTPKQNISLSFCLHVLRNLGLENMNTDAAVPGLNRNNVYRLLTLQPTYDILSVFSNQLDIFIESQIALLRENRTLATLRDTLLPKLLSGEINLLKSNLKLR